MASTTRATHSLVRFRISSSQNRSVVQPSSARSRLTTSSRRILRSILGNQNSRLVRNCSDVAGQPRPCQNDESQKIASFALGTAKSGRPGIFRYCFRYRTPAAHNADPKTSSIWVPDAGTLPIGFSCFLAVTDSLRGGELWSQCKAL
jgi:hypothetical protein